MLLAACFSLTIVGVKKEVRRDRAVAKPVGHFANIWQILYPSPMTTMNISLSDELKGFVDQRIRTDGYSTSSEYIRELIRRDQDRVAFRQYLTDGMNSGNAGRMDASYFDSLRKLTRGRAKKAA